MNDVVLLVESIEDAGGALRLRGDKISYDVPEELESLIPQLRAHKEAVREVLRQRETVPKMPDGVRLITWQLKEPPVALETYSIVMNPHRFATVSLEQLGRALKTKRSTGYSVPQILDRLRQVGVTVAVESETERHMEER